MPWTGSRPCLALVAANSARAIKTSKFTPAKKSICPTAKSTSAPGCMNPPPATSAPLASSLAHHRPRRHGQIASKHKRRRT